MVPPFSSFKEHLVSCALPTDLIRRVWEKETIYVWARTILLALGFEVRKHASQLGVIGPPVSPAKGSARLQGPNMSISQSQEKGNDRGPVPFQLESPHPQKEQKTMEVQEDVVFQNRPVHFHVCWKVARFWTNKQKLKPAFIA